MNEKHLFRIITLFVLGYLVWSLFFAPGRERGGKVTLGPPVSDQPDALPLHPAPALEATVLGSGAPVSLSDTMAGRAAVLTLWAPWCPACVAELPDLERLAKKLGDKVAVISVAIQYSNAAEVRQIVESKGVSTMPIWLDSAARAAEDWGVSVLPTTVMIDAKGIVRYRLNGARDWDSESALGDVRAVMNAAKPAETPE